MINLILASTSPFRKELLQRLALPFSVQAPAIDEQQLTGEDAREMALRLAQAKASKVAESVSDAIVIGSDQTLECDGQVMGKPLTPEKAVQQLTLMRGKTLTFHTGLAVINTTSGDIHTDVVDCTVKFRQLTDDEIQRYIDTEQPLNCAGSFKSEALGISLLDSLDGSDPTALVGLPLISLSRILRQEGLAIP